MAANEEVLAGGQEDARFEDVERLTYSVEEAAVAVGIGRDTMRKLVNSGKIPYIRYGHGPRVPKESLHRWLLEEAELNIGHSGRSHR